MSRFQAQTNAVLSLELDQIQSELGLRGNQKADLLRELATIASWVIRQSLDGRQVQASGDDGVQVFRHPTLDQIRESAQPSRELKLSAEETARLSQLMEGELELSSDLKESLRRIASDDRTPPELVWSDR